MAKASRGGQPPRYTDDRGIVPQAAAAIFAVGENVLPPRVHSSVLRGARKALVLGFGTGSVGVLAEVANLT